MQRKRGKLVSISEVIADLPSLPSRRAILLGWGVPASLLAEVQELPAGHRPHSPGPAFWDALPGTAECDLDWSTVADLWVPSPQPERAMPCPETPEETQE